MPRKNTRTRGKLLPHHVYNRGRGGRSVFRDDADRRAFRDMLASRVSRVERRLREHRKVTRVEGAEVMAMCLMTTHFHLIIWQREDEALRRLMQGLLTSYVRYYNRRHGTSGPLFAGPFDRARSKTARI